LLWLKALESITEQHLFTQQADFKSENVVANLHRYCQTLRSNRELRDSEVMLLLSRIADACVQAHKA
jgi:hypothetical protein